jgi:hydroxymethylpyrimidine/phosphomethylpyrimidine kinase
MKTALTIAGSDPSGGAGIQADLKTFSVLGVYGMSVITAVTVQNTQGVKESLQIEPKLIRRQIDAVVSDIAADATKSGMLASRAIIEEVEDAIKANKLAPYVCDPVMASKVGSKLIDDDAVEAMRKKLFPLATVVTPNLREAARLTGSKVEAMNNTSAARDAARRIIEWGAKAVVIKGIDAGDNVVDILFDGKEFLEFADKKQPSEKSHGSGCAFSAAITAGLASRMTLVEAVDQAKQLVNMAIQYSDGQGRGTAPVNVLAFKPKKK